MGMFGLTTLIGGYCLYYLIDSIKDDELAENTEGLMVAATSFLGSGGITGTFFYRDRQEQKKELVIEKQSQNIPKV